MPGPVSEAIRWQAVGLSRAGATAGDIALQLGIARITVHRILRRYRNTNNVTPDKSTGRPRKTTAREDRLLLNMVRRDRTRSARALSQDWQQTLNRPISRETTNRRMLERGYKAYRPVKKPKLSARHKALRLNFARQHQNLTVPHWRHVVFADESRFELHRVDGRMRVRHLRGESLQDDCVQEIVTGHGGSVHVWGAFHNGGTSQLVTLQNNVNGMVYRNILETNLIPWARGVFGDNWRFQDDNAPAHRARIVQDFIAQIGIQPLHQPPVSPDCNPIENLWAIIGDAVSSRDVQPSNLGELAQALQEEWQALTPQTLQSLVESMPRRMAAVIQARGGHTKY